MGAFYVSTPFANQTFEKNNQLKTKQKYFAQNPMNFILFKSVHCTIKSILITNQSRRMRIQLTQKSDLQCIFTLFLLYFHWFLCHFLHSIGFIFFASDIEMVCASVDMLIVCDFEFVPTYSIDSFPVQQISIYVYQSAVALYDTLNEFKKIHLIEFIARFIYVNFRQT